MSPVILVRAIAAAAMPAVIAVLVVPEGPTMMLTALVAVPTAFVCRPRTRGRTATWALAIVLAAIATIAAVRARDLTDAALRTDAWASIDLTSAPMPKSPPRYVEVTGILRDGFVLAEYDVPEGKIADQSRPADAVLVPMTGSTDPSIRLEGAVVVARVRARAHGGGVITLRGRTEPLAPALLHTLVDLGGGDAGEVDGVLVDTLAIPAPREAWTAIAVALLLVLASTTAFTLARR